ncbi:MAG TPA: SRPBCC domain-containing protein [Gemmatimonadaceae bacterium]|nr:SRPBCC domain-containing protein [Gemmatimonadaceae bacterium]
MSKSTKTIEFTFERTIAAAPKDAYDAWLNREVPGTPWHESDQLILDTKVDGFFYWLVRGTAHYGRFTVLERPGRIQHTWMSRYTLGEESTVTVSFKKKGSGTLMTLVHSGLPDHEKAKTHQDGWNYFLDAFAQQLGVAVVE